MCKIIACTCAVLIDMFVFLLFLASPTLAGWITLEMKEAWKRQRDAQTPAQGILFGQEPCGGGT
jgi:hypothetical protein